MLSAHSVGIDNEWTVATLKTTNDSMSGAVRETFAHSDDAT